MKFGAGHRYKYIAVVQQVHGQEIVVARSYKLTEAEQTAYNLSQKYPNKKFTVKDLRNAE